MKVDASSLFGLNYVGPKVYGNEDEAISRLVKSIERQGWDDASVITLSNGGILDGWLRVQALKKIGLLRLQVEVENLTGSKSELDLNKMSGTLTTRSVRVFCKAWAGTNQYGFIFSSGGICECDILDALLSDLKARLLEVSVLFELWVDGCLIAHRCFIRSLVGILPSSEDEVAGFVSTRLGKANLNAVLVKRGLWFSEEDSLLLRALLKVHGDTSAMAVEYLEPEKSGSEESEGKSLGLEESTDCYYCVLKHLGQAAVLWHESRSGYPLHIVLTYGHMAEAERETGCLALRGRIREARLLLMTAGQTPDWLALFQEATDARQG